MTLQRICYTIFFNDYYYIKGIGAEFPLNLLNIHIAYNSFFLDII